MLGRLFRLLIILPALVALYAAANSIGVTDTVSEATGVEIPDDLTIPGLDKVLDVREQAEDEARQYAVKALRKEVRKRYGAEAAALVPNDLTASEAQRILTKVASGADRSEFEDLVVGSTGGGKGKGGSGGGGGSKGGSGSTGSRTDGVVSINGNAKTFNKARQQLAALTVKGRAPMTGYSRDEFGSEWSDSAGSSPWTGNGCDTRDDVLKRDLTKITFEPGSKCEIATGVLPYERYTGHKNVRFDADGAYEFNFDIEHVVALGNVWVSGGQQMTEAKRAAIANDPINLFAADPSSNRQKGDADAATWLPSNKAYRCGYVSLQIKVKTKYGLSVTSAEKTAMARILDGCPA